MRCKRFCKDLTLTRRCAQLIRQGLIDDLNSQQRTMRTRDMSADSFCLMNSLTEPGVLQTTAGVRATRPCSANCLNKTIREADQLPGNSRSMLYRKLVSAAVARLAVFLGIHISCFASCAAPAMVPARCALVCAPDLYIFFLSEAIHDPMHCRTKPEGTQGFRDRCRELITINAPHVGCIITTSPFSGNLSDTELETD